MKSSQLRLFADDSIIYKTIKSQKDCDSLQEDLDAAARWESDWLMAFHLSKKNPVKHNYLLHNHTLEEPLFVYGLIKRQRSRLMFDS
jgi:hypothetical protein